MTAETVTIKVYETSRNKLRVIAALREETHPDTIERLLSSEFDKLASFGKVKSLKTKKK